MSDSSSETNSNVAPGTDVFVGRVRELALLDECLEKGRRLITLFGPPGAGKTRLARRFCEELLAEDGAGRWREIWFIDLSAADSLDGLLAVTTAVLGLSLPGGESPEDSVARVGRAIRERGPVLLVLDNVEQLVEPVSGAVEHWLEQATELSVIATSRERLRVASEHLVELGPLAVPPLDVGSPEAVEEYDAARLFLERTRATRSDFSLAQPDVPTLATLVRQLDGLPLAIELAAARMNLLDLRTILERLDRRLGLLSLGVRGRSRQATLRAAIEWSWAHLEPWERDALAQCSVFRGTFSLGAAEGVMDLSEHADAPELLDVVQSLRDKSLIRADRIPGLGDELRLALYQSIQSFAAEKLAEMGGAEAAICRHADYYGTLGSRLAEVFDVAEETGAAHELTRERDNLQAVISRARRRFEEGIEPADVPQAGELAAHAVRAALGLEPILHAQGPAMLHRELLEAALAAADATEVSTELRVHGRISMGRTLRLLGRMEQSEAILDEAGELLGEGGNPVLEGWILRERGCTAMYAGRLEVALNRLDAAVAAFRKAGDRVGEAAALAVSGSVHLLQGTLTQSAEMHLAALESFRKLGATRRADAARINLSTTYLRKGDVERGRRYAEQALANRRKAGDRRAEAYALSNLASALGHTNELEEACQACEQAVEIFFSLGEDAAAVSDLALLGDLYLDLGRIDDAKRIHLRLLDLSQEAHVPAFDLVHHRFETRRAWVTGEIRTAQQAAEVGLECARTAGNRRAERLFLAEMAALTATLGDRQEARRIFEEAEAVELDSPDDPYLEATRLNGGHLDLLDYRLALKAEDSARAEARLQAVGRRLTRAFGGAVGDGPKVASATPPAERSAVVRRAAERLIAAVPTEVRTRLVAHAKDPEKKALVVAEGGRWFRPPDGAEVDLGRKHVSVRFLRTLVEARRKQGAQPVPADDLIERVWPDEFIHPEAAANRLYVAANTLRKTGLGQLLQSGPEGYFLDPAVTVVWLEEE